MAPSKKNQDLAVFKDFYNEMEWSQLEHQAKEAGIRVAGEHQKDKIVEKLARMQVNQSTRASPSRGRSPSRAKKVARKATTSSNASSIARKFDVKDFVRGNGAKFAVAAVAAVGYTYALLYAM